IRWKQLRKLFFILTCRSGLAFLLSALVLFSLPELSTAMTMLIIVFPQSSASFWPFAHMSAINQMGDKQIFNTKLAISFLACSLPFSTASIISVFSLSAYFTQPLFLIAVGGSMLILSITPWLRDRIMISRSARAVRQHESREPVAVNG
ncbi:MAG: hypothetical protein P8X57_12215, partial [Cyclobacteriaceae bacterium]